MIMAIYKKISKHEISSHLIKWLSLLREKWNKVDCAYGSKTHMVLNSYIERSSLNTLKKDRTSFFNGN